MLQSESRHPRSLPQVWHAASLRIRRTHRLKAGLCIAKLLQKMALKSFLKIEVRKTLSPSYFITAGHYRRTAGIHSCCSSRPTAQFFLDVPSGPFYGFNRDGAKNSQGIIQSWWRQEMMGSVLAHYEGIKAFSETDQTDDLKAISVPTLVMQGDDDQIAPYKDASLLQAKLLKNATLTIYPGLPHGLMTTHADVINADILAFLKC